MCRMKAAAWIGGLLIVAGVALGFMPQGECGSTFQPYDWNGYAGQVAEAELFGTTGPPDCVNVTHPTVPVWLLIGAGVACLIGAGATAYSRWGTQETADSHD